MLLINTIIAVKRQLGAIMPVTEGAGSSLNGVTGTAGSAVGTGESTVGGVAGTAEKTVAGTAGGGVGGGLLGTRQLGNLPATLEKTVHLARTGISGSPSPKSKALLLIMTDLIQDPTGLYGALDNLRTVVNAGDITNHDMTNLPQAVQDVIAHLSVA